MPVEGITPLNGELNFSWIDEAKDEQEALDFSVTLSAVDLAGNVGPESEPVRVRDGGRDGGCRMASSRGRLSLDPFLILLAALVARRSRGSAA